MEPEQNPPDRRPKLRWHTGRRVKGRPMTFDDPLFKLIGSATDAPPTDSSRKYEYLVDALSTEISSLRPDLQLREFSDAEIATFEEADRLTGAAVDVAQQLGRFQAARRASDADDLGSSARLPTCHQMDAREPQEAPVTDHNQAEQALIERWIEPNPHKPGPANARLVDYGVAVWALVASLKAVNFDVAQIAADYEIPTEAVYAALAYYKRQQAAIDARLLLNAM